jgi:hypothetical protein
MPVTFSRVLQGSRKIARSIRVGEGLRVAALAVARPAIISGATQRLFGPEASF